MYPSSLLSGSIRTFSALGVCALSLQLSAQPQELSTYGVRESTDAGYAANSIPIDFLSGDDLARRASPDLGTLVSGMPGVHMVPFGSGASRPTIRGFNLSRIRVVESGLDLGDVSDLSPDHAVGTDTTFASAVEILRGPASLLYGSYALGGAVNIIDRRVARFRPEAGVISSSGFASGNYQTVNEGYTASTLIELGLDPFSLTFSGSTINWEDYDIPGFAELPHDEEHEGEEEHLDEDEHHDEEAIEGTLENSYRETRTGSISGSWFPTENQRLTFSFFNYVSIYGVPGHAHEEEGHDHLEDDEHHDEEEHGEEEEEVFIDLTQDRWSFEYVIETDAEYIEEISLNVGYTDYLHTEFEGEEVGSLYDQTVFSGRAEVDYSVDDHNAGTFGIETRILDFESGGGEAFLPAHDQDDWSAYWFHHWSKDTTHIEGAVRLEARDMESNVFDYDDVALSGSVSGITQIGSVEFSLSGTYAERHPAAPELISEGPHVALGQFTIGDTSLEKETSLGIDAGFTLRGDIGAFTVTAFYNSIDDYIYSRPLGAEEDGLPVFLYTATDAEFYGFEVEATSTVWTTDNAELELRATGDLVIAEEEDGTPLPYTPPATVRLEAIYTWNSLELSSRITHAFEQDETPEEILPTDSYTAWNIGARYSWLTAEGASINVGLKVENLLDEEIRLHTSTIKDRAPQPGRNLVMSVGVDW